MKKRLKIFGFLFFLAIGMAFSQTQVRGIVVDEKGEPIIGASVLVKGTTSGASTDIDGKFTLSAPSPSTLVVSYVGMKTKEVPASANMKIVLQSDTELLKEVVVVGYGTQKKENLTGAVSSVDVSKTLDSRPIADIGRGLQGTTAGLNISIPNSEVGSDPLIKVRGQIGSISGSSKPLILLDNVEIPSLQMVNPNDIESISILKDAASASIYGAKGAFGVILITSKKGAKTESVNVQYTNNFSWQNVAKPINMAGVEGLEYALLSAERVEKTFTGAFWKVNRDSYEKALEWQQKWGSKVAYDDPMVYGRDWVRSVEGYKYGYRIYDTAKYMIDEWAPTQNHDVSISGKSGKVSYNIGLGYLNQQGMLKPAKHDDFRKYNASLRLSTELNKYVTARMGVIYSNRNKRYPYATASTTADPWYYLYRWSQLYPFGTEDGDILRSPASELAQANTANREDNYANINLGTTIKFTDNWNAVVDYTYANSQFVNNAPGTRFYARDTWSGAVASVDANNNPIFVNENGEVVPQGTPGSMRKYELSMYEYTSHGSNPDRVYRSTRNGVQNTFNAFTTYNMNLNDIHNLKFMLGVNRVTYDEKSNWSQITDIIDLNNPQFGLTQGTQTAGGSAAWEAQLGYFGRINYAFMNKYLLEANLRYDGTSKFPTDLKWRWFPSFSAGWLVTEESWMKWSSPILSSLKFRGSWGTIGDQTVSNSLYVPTMEAGQISWIGANGQKVYYVGSPNAVSPYITWQDITTLDLGFDMRLFRNRLGIVFDWYRRDTENMIVPIEGVTYTYGTNAPKGNFGSLRTNGWELAVDFNHQFSNGLKVNVMGTLSDAITKITKYGSTQSIDDWYVGKTYGEIWGYETDRLYQKSDFVLDANGNTKLITLTKEQSKYVGKKVNQLSGEKPVYQAYLQTANNFYFGPGDVKFKDLNGDGEINDGSRQVDDYGDLTVIGNSTPRFEYGLRLGADWHGIDFSMFFQGIGSRQIWGDGNLVIPGYNPSDGAMPATIAQDFWREDRTDAFYPRPFDQGSTNTGNNMHRQSKYLLDMSYMRLKNITLGYSFNENLLKNVYMKSARIYMSLENFVTFDNLRGLPIDPEVVSGYSMFNETNYNSGRTGVGTPAFKAVSVGLQLNF